MKYLSSSYILRYISGLTLVVFLVYWSSTLLYVSPSNYIRIQFNNYLNSFELVFFQKWDFFAPPPKTNTRLYYNFINKETGKFHTVEALKNITEKKQKEAPFNTEEELLDYLLASSADRIRNVIIRHKKISQAVNPDSSFKFHMIESQNTVNDLGRSIPSYQTLLNYAIVISERQNLNPRKYYVKLVITEQNIIPFSERNSEIRPDSLEEKAILETPKINLSNVNFHSSE